MSQVDRKQPYVLFKKAQKATALGLLLLLCISKTIGAKLRECCMCLRPISSRGQRRNIIAECLKHDGFCSAAICGSCPADKRQMTVISSDKRGKWSEKLKTLLWYFKVYRSKLLSYHTPSRCIWTQIWLQTADTSRWQHTHQTAGRRTSLPDKTRQVSVSCQSPYMSDSVEQNQV